MACLYLKCWKEKEHELGSVYVLHYQGKASVAEWYTTQLISRENGIRRLIASVRRQRLSFQSFAFIEGKLSDLHEDQRRAYETSGRNSKILYTDL